MGSRGRVTAAFSFSWDSIAHQTREIYYEQRNKHDAPPNWTYSSEGDETLAFALIGPVRQSPLYHLFSFLSASAALRLQWD